MFLRYFPKVKLLFTHSYFLKFDPKQYWQATPYPPLATLFAMAYLKENGFEVKLFDTMFCQSPSEIHSTIDLFKPDVLVIYDDGFNYLTKMCLTNMREAAFEIQKFAKQKGCKVITSSSDSTDHYEDYLDNGADFIIIGEGEQTLLEICQAIKMGKAFDEIKDINGLTFFCDNELVKTSARNVMTNLDSLPPPAWEEIDITPYKTMWLKHHNYFSINFVTTRGCPYKCNWCAKPIYGNRYNSTGAENIVLQIKNLQQKFGFSHIWFADDIFGLKPEWLKEFAYHIKKENLQIRYKIQNRVDLLLEEKNIEYLAESGCDIVWLGAESGSQKILDMMDKGIRLEQIFQVTKLLKAHNIKVAFFLQFGYLGEKIEDIILTINMVKELLPDDIGISVSYPLPGTKFYELVKEQLKQKSNWTDSDELHLMFHNTYKSEFYKQLHRVIHKIYRKALGLRAIKDIISSPMNINKTLLKQSVSLFHLIPGEIIEKRKLRAIEPDVAKSL
jgi:anaerobic magnesium-protoporphyrin IX monomethyl ester cyclase